MSKEITTPRINTVMIEQQIRDGKKEWTSESVLVLVDEIQYWQQQTLDLKRTINELNKEVEHLRLVVGLW